MEKKSLLPGLTVTKLKAFILSIVIAIVLASFVIYIIETIDPTPKWNDYCGDVKGPRERPIYKDDPNEINQTSCEEVEGASWRNGYCDYTYECQKEYDKAENKHNFVVFLVAVPAGLIAIGVGIALALPSVSFGLLLGGVFLTFFGTVKYWDNFSNWIRVVILALVLAVLIWLGYKKLGS